MASCGCEQLTAEHSPRSIDGWRNISESTQTLLCECQPRGLVSVAISLRLTVLNEIIFLIKKVWFPISDHDT